MEKSMPPMTRPAISPPMCMKLSTKGVRPMQTCLELRRGAGRELGRELGQELGRELGRAAGARQGLGPGLGLGAGLGPG